MDIPGFVHRSIHRPKKKRSWRGSGGISIYIRDHLADFFTWGPSEGVGMSILVDKRVSNLSYNLCIIGVYIAPDGVDPVHGDAFTALGVIMDKVLRGDRYTEFG